jgi:bacterioferritin-associated ferredoxin
MPVNRLANANHSHYIATMIICICHRVSDRDIARAAQAGCASFDELQFELSVATACGRCHDCARETFDRHAAPACALRHAAHGADRAQAVAA